MLNIRCQCGKHVKVPETAIGHAGKCPYCRSSLRLIAPHFEHGGTAFTDRLVIATGPIHAGDQLLQGGPGPIEIGKLPGKHICLAGDKVSRSHCRLVRFNGKWVLEDQGSKNGTHVNGQPITRHRLVDGDAVQVGEFLLQFLGSGPDTTPLKDESHTASQPETARASPSSAAGTAVAPPAQSKPEAQPEVDARVLDDHLYQLHEGEAVVVPAAQEEQKPDEADGPTCPGCQQKLPKTARICVACGIDLKTGRTILTSSEDHLDEIYSTVESIVRVVSWPVPFMYFPIASEALGVRRPYTTWAIAAVTVLTSMAFWIAVAKKPDRLMTLKQYMHWCGNAAPTAKDIEIAYAEGFGDYDAYRMKYDELTEYVEAKKITNVSNDEIARKALDSLPLKDRCFGEYEPHQLVTCAFLHGNLMHLVGNLVFLLVIGGRVNAMLGNPAMVIVYPLLAVASSCIHMIALQDQPPAPAIGASGAIMGLAGMYFVLMPVNRVHMVLWWRPWQLFFLFGFDLRMKMWPTRGFWVLLFYISFDVFATLIGSQDGVGHWAHLGGFLTGMVLGFVLLISRLVNARGSDLLSAIFGQRVWWLVGKPDVTRPSPIALF